MAADMMVNYIRRPYGYWYKICCIIFFAFFGFFSFFFEKFGVCVKYFGKVN